MLRSFAVNAVVVAAIGLCVMGCPAPNPVTRYSVTDLGSFGGNRSNALGVNDQGQVVGLSEMPSEIAQGFVWDEATGIHSVGSFNEHSEAWDINEAGQIVGETNTLGNTIHPFLWMPDEPNGTTGTLHDMGAPASDWAGAWQINESGQVTGWSALPGPDEWRPFVWTPDDPNGTAGSYVHLGTLGGVGAETYAINDLGQTAGYSVAPDSDFYHAIVWNPDTPNGSTGTMYDLGTLGGNESEARGINNSGVVVGEAWLKGNKKKHAFRWVPSTPNGGSGVMKDLGTLGGDASIAYSITDNGEIVGRSTTRDGENAAFVWTQAGGMVDLNKRLGDEYRYNQRTGKGWKITIARDINAQGWIVGSGRLDDGELRAVLLRPIAGN